LLGIQVKSWVAIALPAIVDAQVAQIMATGVT
jgi:hypothetical protein